MKQLYHSQAMPHKKCAIACTVYLKKSLKSLESGRFREILQQWSYDCRNCRIFWLIIVEISTIISPVASS